VFTNRVHTVFHFEILPLDAHIVAFIQAIKNLLGLNWGFCNIFIDFGHFSWEHKFYILKLGQEQFKVSHFLLAFQFGLISNKIFHGWISKKNSLFLRHKFIKSMARLYKANFTFKSKIRHIFCKENFSIGTREIHKCNTINHFYGLN